MDEGQTDVQIAEVLSSTPDAVKQVRYRSGISPLTQRRDSNVTRAVTQEASVTETSGNLATRFAELQGLSSEAEEDLEPPVDSLLQRFLNDPSAFFEFLGFSLYPYQEKGLELMLENDRTSLVWGRQTGKDTLTSLHGLWLALTSPGAIVVCVSPSQRQSDLWMGKLRALALSKPDIRDAITDLSQAQIAFYNGSKVYSLPSGSQGSATLRGFSAVSLLVVNEAAWVGEETFQAVQPFLATSAAQGRTAKLDLISTPFGQSGYLWRAWNADLFAKSTVPSSASPLISEDFLAQERGTMDALTVAAEYEGRFLSAQDAYSPTELIQRCVQAYPLVESPLPEHEGLIRYLGSDWARIAGADRTVLTIVGVDEEGHGRVLWIRTFEGEDYVSQANYVTWLDSLWNFAVVSSDASNHAVNDLLRSKGLGVDAVNFTVPSKVELFGRLKNALEAGKLAIPNHPDLIGELSTFRYRISEKGNLLLHHAEGGHDDYPDSLALSARAITSNPGTDVEPRSFGEILDVVAEGLRYRDVVPAGFSQFDPRVAEAMRYGPPEAYDPRCPECGASWRTGSHVKAHRLSDCQRAGEEDI